MEMMIGEWFVDGNGPRITRGRAPEVTEIRRRLRYVTNAVLFQARGRSKIVGLAEAKRAEIFRSWPQRVVPNPIGHCQDLVFLQKISDLRFFGCRVRDPIVDLVRDFQWRYIFVAILFVNFERDGAIPFLPSHRQQFFWREWHERNISEEEHISVATKRGLLRKRRQFFLQLSSKLLQRIGCAFDCAV